jgi:alkanesulfonate monooxygenase SsuD/methylene tetrahydromethanopterin reductase-like flavin-dependent oxidoreductase (luciferase family)
MWQGERGDERPFAGKHYHLERPLNVPQSLSRPHPPILIGGSGERKTLRFVARYADACNLYPTPDLPAKLDVLRRHCAEEGQDYDAIEKTCMVHFAIGGGDTKTRELIAELQRLGELGIETVIGILSRVDPIASLETISREVIPAVAEE